MQNNGQAQQERESNDYDMNKKGTSSRRLGCFRFFHFITSNHRVAIYKDKRADRICLKIPQCKRNYHDGFTGGKQNPQGFYSFPFEDYLKTSTYKGSTANSNQLKNMQNGKTVDS